MAAFFFVAALDSGLRMRAEGAVLQPIPDVSPDVSQDVSPVAIPSAWFPVLRLAHIGR